MRSYNDRCYTLSIFFLNMFILFVTSADAYKKHKRKGKGTERKKKEKEKEQKEKKRKKKGKRKKKTVEVYNIKYELNEGGLSCADYPGIRGYCFFN